MLHVAGWGHCYVGQLSLTTCLRENLVSDNIIINDIFPRGIGWTSNKYYEYQQQLGSICQICEHSISAINCNKQKITTVFAVNEESEDDEGYSSIAGYDPNKYRKLINKHLKGWWELTFSLVCVISIKRFLSASKTKLRRNKIREEDLRIVEGDTKEMLTEKFLLLRDAYDKLKDENTLLEYENESLKDYQDEREEEVKLNVGTNL